jgi:hypothetical protein
MMLPLLGVLTAGTAIAQTETGAANARVERREKRMEARTDELAAKLGLDAQGKAKLEATFARHREQAKPVWQEMKQTRAALEAELGGAKDATKISSLTAQLSSDRQKLEALREAQMSELKGQLTPAQYAQLILSRHEGRRFHHRHHRGGDER